MKAKVFGTNLTSAYISLLSADLGLETIWIRGPRWPAGFIPLRLSHPVLHHLRRLCHYYSCSSDKAGLVPDAFGALSYDKVKNLLMKLCERVGVLQQTQSLFEQPEGFQDAQTISIFSGAESEVRHWPTQIYQPASGSRYWKGHFLFRSPTFFNTTFFDGAFAGGAFYNLDNGWIVLEAIDETYFSLSVYAHSQFNLDRILKSLNHPKSDIVLPLKTLILGSEKVQEYTEQQIVSGLTARSSSDLFLVGPAAGASSFLSQNQERFYLNEANAFGHLLAEAKGPRSHHDNMHKNWMARVSRRKKTAFLASKIWLSLWANGSKLKALYRKDSPLVAKVQESTYCPF